MLYREASLLDDGRFEDWLAMLAPDIVDQAPIRPEVDPAAEPVKSALQLDYFTDDLTMPQIRVGKTPGRCSKWTAPSCSTDTAGAHMML